MNLYVERTRPATVIIKGKKKQIVDRSSFNLWQTPTNITCAILRSGERAQAYIDWVNSLENEDGDTHIAEFRDWIRESEEEDFTITFYEV
jgi:hypothetical protein